MCDGRTGGSRLALNGALGGFDGTANGSAILGGGFIMRVSRSTCVCASVSSLLGGGWESLGCSSIGVRTPIGLNVLACR